RWRYPNVQCLGGLVTKVYFREHMRCKTINDDISDGEMVKADDDFTGHCIDNVFHDDCGGNINTENNNEDNYNMTNNANNDNWTNDNDDNCPSDKITHSNNNIEFSGNYNNTGDYNDRQSVNEEDPFYTAAEAINEIED
ncbi:unnamed protein product, partial [Allacma fusca]